MKDNVTEICTKETKTPVEALEQTLRQARRGEIKDVLIIGYLSDGIFFNSSSEMTNAHANFLFDVAKREVMEDVMRQGAPCGCDEG